MRWKLALLGVLFLLFVQSVVAQQTFNTNNLFLKVSVSEGKDFAKSLDIYSKQASGYHLETNIRGLMLGESDFYLSSGETKTIKINFNSSGLSTGVYSGNLKITNNAESFELPVIFEIESSDLFFDANLDIPVKGSNIAPGGKVLGQIRIYDLTSAGGTLKGIGPSRLDIRYHIYDLSGREIASESENIVVDNSVQLSKSLSLPSNISEGYYVFAVGLQYKSSVSSASQFFEVAKNKSPAILERIGEWNAMGFILIAVLFLAVIFVSTYIVREKSKAIAELRRYNSLELKRQREFLMEQEKLLLSRGVSRTKVKREVKKKIKQLRKKHRERVRQFRKLKKAGKSEDELNRQLKEWKKAGYNTLAFESKIGRISIGEMKNMLKKWKEEYSEGYKK